MSDNDETLDMDSLSDEDRQAVAEMRDAWKDLANSMQVTPVIYDDGQDDGTGVTKAVWAGKPISGLDAQKKADAITKAKMKEYDRVGPEAFADTEPLENIVLPGEFRLR